MIAEVLPFEFEFSEPTPEFDFGTKIDGAPVYACIDPSPISWEGRLVTVHQTTTAYPPSAIYDQWAKGNFISAGGRYRMTAKFEGELWIREVSVDPDGARACKVEFMLTSTSGAEIHPIDQNGAPVSPLGKRPSSWG